MPEAPAKPLHETEIALIRRWITQGATNDSPESMGPRWSPDKPPVYQGNPTLASVDVSQTAGLIAIAGYHEVLLIEAETGNIRHRLIGNSPRINSLEFSPTGEQLAVAGGTPGQTGELQVWDVKLGELLLSKAITFDTITGVAWSPDAKLIAIGANDNTIRGLDSQTGEQVLFQGAHEDWVRDTVFTNDGKHIVSVARDMSCKLTEVETQRFIDNVTSITPGALSGGLNSLAVHPTRDEILVGGSDGIVKAYRVFRQTKRQIGDDANLIRRFPKMTGRVQEVAISPNGKFVAAASTIDGQSEVRIWHYDFDGTLTDKLKNILTKRVANRKPNEKQFVEESRSKEIKSLGQFQLKKSAIYSLDVSNDGSVWFTATDGHLRKLTGDKIAKDYRLNLSKDSQAEPEALATVAFSPAKWTEREALLTQENDTSSDVDSNPSYDFVELSVEPKHIKMMSPYAYTQLVATATLKDGGTLDVTDRIRVHGKNIAIRKGGLIRPTKNATGKLHVTLGSLKKAIPFESSGQDNFAVDFVRDVNPVLSRLGCNQGTCHGAQKGKNGFRLSLRGYDPVFDLRALTDDLAARRINPAAPETSLMLRKPLGLTPHEGGTLMVSGDPYHAVLREWIASGSKLNRQSKKVESIDVFPKNPVVEATDAKQQIRIVANYGNGITRDVTAEAFIDSGNTEVATTSQGGVLQAIRRGEAPVLVRYEGAYAATTLTVMGDRTGYKESKVTTWNHIDDLVAKKWRRMKIMPSDLADDATFLRRIHLDLTGLPPTSKVVRSFLADETPTREKRASIINHLIGNDAFVEYWTNKWADLLQVNRKYLGVEGSQKYRKWIRSAVAENRPYNQLAYQILTASGSNAENPPASYFKVLRNPEDAMENTTHLFLGIRFNCNKCHDHPFERWTQDQYYEMAAFFAQVGRTRDPASGKKNISGSAVEKATPLYEIIADTDEGEVLHAKTGNPVSPAFPYELNDSSQVAKKMAQQSRQTLVSKAGKQARKTDAAESKTVKNPLSRRVELAKWMTSPGNSYFARSYVNRIWGYLTGVGLIEPIDDIRAGNPATNPELLEYLTTEFIKSDFDTRHVMRLICNSRTYGLSVESNPLNADDHQNYSHATPRRLPAEVIYDAVHSLTGSISQIPGMPAGTRAAAATDSGVALTDGFLQNLGRPVRETACECERSDDLQLGPVMALISGPTIGTAISDPKNELEKIVADHPDDFSVAEEIFLRALGRLPTKAEQKTFAQINSQIADDHQTLVDRLAASEASWKTDFPRLEATRKKQLADTEKSIAKREAAIKADRTQLESQRKVKIKEAEQKLADEKSKLPAKVKQWVTTHQKGQVIWHPLLAKSATANTGAILQPQPDRSLLVSGKMGKATYNLAFETDLSEITGFRIEAMTDPSLPSNGPGRAANFVVTEIAVEAGPASDAKNLNAVTIASAKADFLQDGFKIEQTFDGNVGNQNAWAVSGANGVEHWATFKFTKPIQSDGLTRLQFTISQNHRAENHQLGRFRISVTKAHQDIPLGLSESLASAASTKPENRSEEQSQLLTQYVQATDKVLRDRTKALAAAKKPVPPDTELVRLQTQQKALQETTPIDPALVKLRENVQISQTQLKNHRLTSAEDLTWALVNTPAFLFNH